MWYGPAHAQINNLFPSQFQGFAVAVFNFMGTISGSLITLLLGVFNEKYVEHGNPANAGYILGAVVIFSYVFAAPFFLLSANEFALKYQKRKATIESKVTDNQL